MAMIGLEIFGRGEDALGAVDGALFEGSAPGELADVGPGDERLVARARDHHHARPGVVAQPVERVAESRAS